MIEKQVSDRTLVEETLFVTKNSHVCFSHQTCFTKLATQSLSTFLFSGLHVASSIKPRKMYTGYIFSAFSGLERNVSENMEIANTDL